MCIFGHVIYRDAGAKQQATACPAVISNLTLGRHQSLSAWRSRDAVVWFASRMKLPSQITADYRERELSISAIITGS
jgi:hypothetical protein